MKALSNGANGQGMTASASRIAIVGLACRLPGAPDVAGFDRLLDAARCAVVDRPTGRWGVERFWHPRTTEPGFSYSFAGGYLDNPFDFDPTVFGMSQREAQQVDPQQRLLMEVVWEALEDAGIRPSSVAGTEVGVYVGASSLDHGNVLASDLSAIETHFMTGNTLSVISNRLSYAFDLRGPSFTVDTACSSSLVAFSQALADLERGRVDTAIVAGVNMLFTHASFVGFSRASMLSPTGLCRPFSAKGDGYVRGEGAVAFVLTRADLAMPGSVRALVRAAGVNSDGRTSGISLPGLDGQKSLLQRLYRESGVSPAALAFVEAHGTGTRVGDPIEATAIGQVLGQPRSEPLPIGSVKANIGHLEPASGAAGLLKAIRALERRVLPATPHLDELNPLIDFDDLRLLPAVDAVRLPATGSLACGVSSFGFGGTNAHAILESAPTALVAPAAPAADRIVISTASKEALRPLATRYAEALEAGADADRLAAASAAHRDLLPFRAVVPMSDGANPALLMRQFADYGAAPDVVTGTAGKGAASICFVYGGNGGQWLGMGRHTMARNPVFRERVDLIDGLFAKLAGWSLRDMLLADDIADKVEKTTVAQPLIFAVQSAVTAALAAEGIVPDIVLGHSIGEVAAAEAAGALPLAEALRLIHLRSQAQEKVHGTGRMIVAACTVDAARDLIAQIGATDLDIAAINGSSSVTLSGGSASVATFAKAARKAKVASRTLEIEYPFHSRLLDGLDKDLLKAFGTIRPGRMRARMVSTVTGLEEPAATYDAHYWWRNMREPVAFKAAVETAADLGATLFVEISSKPILVSPVTDTLREHGSAARVTASIAESDEKSPLDPVKLALGRAIANGAVPKTGATTAPVLDRSLPLPSYPWQRKTLRFQPTTEARDLFAVQPQHPLIGARMAQGQPEWRTLIDTEVVPYLADHVVNGEVVVPGAALAEMALAVARTLWPDGPVGLSSFDILQPILLPRGGMREISVRFAEQISGIEIWSRPRFGPDTWSLHARGRLIRHGRVPAPIPVPGATVQACDHEQVYAIARRSAIQYGPQFRLVRSMRRDEDTMIVELDPATAGTGAYSVQQILHPASLDATFHAFLPLAKKVAGETRTFLPLRFERLTVFQDHAEVVKSLQRVDRDTDNSMVGTVQGYDRAGRLVFELEGVLFRAVTIAREDADEGYVRRTWTGAEGAGLTPDRARAAVGAAAGDVPDSWMLLRAHLRASAFAAFRQIALDGIVHLADLVATGRIATDASAVAGLLIDDLVAAGLAMPDGETVTLADDSGLPAPDAILAAHLAEAPDAAADLMMTIRFDRDLVRFLSNGTPIEPRGPVLERFIDTGALFEPTRKSFTAAIEATLAARPDAVVDILVGEPDCRPILSVLGPYQRAGRVRVTVAGIDADQLARLSARIGADSEIEMLDLSTPAATDRRPFAALALVNGLRAETGVNAALLGRLAPLVVTDGSILIGVPPADPLLAVLAGLGGRALADIVVPDPASLRQALSGSGCGPVAIVETGSDGGVMLVAAAPKPERSFADRKVKLDRTGAATDLAQALSTRLRADGAALLENGAVPPTDFVLLARGGDDGDRETITATAGRLTALGRDPAAVGTPKRLWVVAVARDGAVAADPVACAVLGFARTALNEAPSIDIRLVGIDGNVAPARAADHLADLLARPGREADLRITADGLSVARIETGFRRTDGAPDRAPAARLDFPRRGMIETFRWSPATRRTPEQGEVEVEILATGLNFRDVMLALGLLDDDVLDGGMAGAVFGFECAGRVIACGPDVPDLKAGDTVMGFAAGAFATHVTAPHAAFMKVPAGLSAEAAASVPVAFLTAWYGLVELARLKRGERVLIHGAAGGVGLAALQIARAIGAEVIGTVSTPDKRALAGLFGASRLLDSRSLDFADEVRALGGADVVLNSLSGEAMRASIGCLKPFGRFIELGKRDYVANSLIELRPFRRNLTYFGVDVDQLLAHDPTIVARGLAAIAEGFSDGRYSALPLQVYPSSGIAEAFRLMQSAGHVGKIVIRPPSAAERPAAVRPTVPFSVKDGVELVVGGTGGFGFETASWLAANGAKAVVVASRSGKLAPELEERAARLRDAGVVLDVEQVDASDLASVEALVARVIARNGRVTGVWHTAMVLDDGLISTLTPERIDAVLRPKVDGAANLDRATRGQAVERFVLFSSATTLIGNPGQASYVAANAYLEGLAERRRAAGLPALAIAWGAIADAGVLARKGDVARQLERLTGMAGLASADALARLERLLGEPDTAATVACAKLSRSGAMRDVAILKTPAFSRLFRGETSVVEEAGAADLAEMVAGKSDAQAMKLLAEVVAAEVARILRVAPADIDLDRPLDELGMDSLMALELTMGMESKYGVELPLVAITSVRNLRDLTRRLLTSLRPGEDKGQGSHLDATEQALIAIHGGGADTDGLAETAPVVEGKHQNSAWERL
jgi:acyl transferase domain-containing protein/NADPH:quinone reductase-like Zn-dependent oxidoreductase/acyl carrier protein